MLLVLTYSRIPVRRTTRTRRCFCAGSWVLSSEKLREVGQRRTLLGYRRVGKVEKIKKNLYGRRCDFRSWHPLLAFCCEWLNPRPHRRAFRYDTNNGDLGAFDPHFFLSLSLPVPSRSEIVRSPRVLEREASSLRYAPGGSHALWRVARGNLTLRL